MKPLRDGKWGGLKKSHLHLCPGCRNERHAVSFPDRFYETPIRHNGGQIIGYTGKLIITGVCNKCVKAGISEPKKKEQNRIDSFVYVIQMSNTPYYKIGIAKDVNKRIKTLQAANPLKLSIVLCYYVSDAYSVESNLHSQFYRHRINGEWFTLNVDHVELIKRTLE